MAKHSTVKLIETGFTQEELDHLEAKGLVKPEPSGAFYWTQKSPSSFPKAEKAIWYSHKPLDPKFKAYADRMRA